MKPLGYQSLKATVSIQDSDLIGHNNIETNDVKHSHKHALSIIFNKSLQKTVNVFHSMTVFTSYSTSLYLQKINKFFYLLRPAYSSTSCILTSNSKLHDAGQMACCVSISYFHISHLR